MVEQIFWIGALIGVCWLTARVLARGSHSDGGCGSADERPSRELVQITRRRREEEEQ